MRRLYWLSILVICSTALSTILAGCFGGASERLQSLARGGGKVVWAPAVMNAGEAPLQPLTALEIAGQIGGQMQGIAVQGGYAYIGVGPRLVILDLSVPDRPTLAGQTSILPGLVHAVTVEGSRAYVTTEDGDLRIVDVTDVTRPRDVTAEAADRPRTAQALPEIRTAVANGLIYRAAERAGLQIAEAANPNVSVGSYTALESAADVQVEGSTAYVVDPWSGLHLLDIQNPAAPRELSRVDTPGLAGQVAVAADRAYLLDRWFGLYIVDVSNAQSPVLAGRYAAPQQVDAVVQAGSIAYAAARGDGLWVIDLSDPAAPQAVAHVELPEIGAGLAWMDGYLYVAAAEAGLYIYRLDNARAPEQVAVYTEVGSAAGVTAAGGLVYIADEWMGLRIVNAADPQRPVEVASVEGLPVRDVAVVGNLLYVAADDWDLQVFDISDPSTPRPAQTYAVPGDAMGVVVNGGYAYVAAGGAGFQILSLADGAVVGGWEEAYGRALYYAGGTVYLATEQAGVQVIDVTTPAAPRLVKGLETFGAATHLFGSDAALYVADEVGGLLVLKSRPEQGENQ